MSVYLLAADWQDLGDVSPGNYSEGTVAYDVPSYPAGQLEIPNPGGNPTIIVKVSP